MPDVLPPGESVEPTAPEPGEEAYSHLLPQDQWDKVVAEAPMHATDASSIDYREPEDLVKHEDGVLIVDGDADEQAIEEDKKDAAVGMGDADSEDET